MSGYCWVALRVKLKQENLAIENIERQAFDAWCPMVASSVLRGGIRRQVRQPLFPGYVFAGADFSATPWRPLLSTRGVQSLVRFGNVPGTLSPEFISELKASEQSGELDRLLNPELRPGDRVIIRDRLFHEVIARVVSLPENDRVWLLLEMMGREVRISRKTEVLERLETT